MQNVKAYLRRGAAKESLLRYEEALEGKSWLFCKCIWLPPILILLKSYGWILPLVYGSLSSQYFHIFNAVSLTVSFFFLVMQISSMLLFLNHKTRMLI